MANTIPTFVVTSDTIFIYGKTYYTHAVVNGSNIYSPAVVTAGDPIPSGDNDETYYESSNMDDSVFSYQYFPEVESTETDTNGNTVTVITQEVIRVNNNTGEIFRTTNVSRTTSTTQIAIRNLDIERFTSANILLGHVYRFKFISDFRSLGYVPGGDNAEESGMYRVDQILSYKELLTQGISIYENIYKPLQLTEQLFKADESRFDASTTFYKLVNPIDDEIIYYMPDIFIEDHPDTNVDRYSKVMLAFTLGIYADPNELSLLTNEISALLETRYGISSAIADVITYKDVYLTTQDYANLVSEREGVKRSTSIDLYNVLFASEKAAKDREIMDLRAMVTAYEEILQQQ